MKGYTGDKELAKGLVSQIEKLAGRHPGYRRAHAKGELYEAVFAPNGNAMPYTSALHLQDREVRAMVRFSNVWPIPETPDALSLVKGIAIQFQLPSGEVSNLIGTTVPIFVTKSPEIFFEMLETLNSFKALKPNLRELAKLLAKYPEMRAVFQTIRKHQNAKSFATGKYYSIHAFYLVNEHGMKTPVKFELVPEAGVDSISLKEMASMPRDYLKKELDERLKKGEVRFLLNIVVGEEGDPTDDPTKEWPKERQNIHAGVLSIKSKSAEDQDRYLFDPTVLAPGIECSDDKILQIRKPSYAVSYARRTQEGSTFEVE